MPVSNPSSSSSLSHHLQIPLPASLSYVPGAGLGLLPHILEHCACPSPLLCSTLSLAAIVYSLRHTQVVESCRPRVQIPVLTMCWDNRRTTFIGSLRGLNAKCSEQRKYDNASWHCCHILSPLLGQLTLILLHQVTHIGGVIVEGFNLSLKLILSLTL